MDAAAATTNEVDDVVMSEDVAGGHAKPDESITTTTVIGKKRKLQDDEENEDEQPEPEQQEQQEQPPPPPPQEQEQESEATTTTVIDIMPDETMIDSTILPPKPSTATTTTAEPTATKEVVQFSDALLRFYYDRLFPYTDMFRWLSYGNDPDDEGNVDVDPEFFKRREFSFTLADDVYVRYRSFANKQEFKLAIQKRCPHKIDIGAIFNAPPDMRNSVGNFQPESKELVFDIDMTDYDDVRTCCTGGSICKVCWPLMNAAIHVVDTALREEFGFQSLLWVYSGRRGVHCWVCDERARCLSNDARTAIVNNLSITMSTVTSGGGGGNGQTQYQTPNLPKILPPPFRRAYRILEPYFREVCLQNMGMLNTEFHTNDDDSNSGRQLPVHPEHFNRILAMIGNDELANTLRKLWLKKDRAGVKRWEQLKTSVKDDKWAGKAKKLKQCIPEIVFAYVFPRLDINVSKQMHHLLKSPFVIHPKTGRVCVPIDPETCDDFDPFSVPTVSSLYDEVNNDTQGSGFTSLDVYVSVFRQRLLRRLDVERAEMLREKHKNDPATRMEF